ncbi:hypothetical protein BJ166DRAFT_39984 [Pestalotiopsis sp. NC0098]|nr:hypothetical protein BJ166DRAFT_39984 [Pestalotiopsis sp. NC0098]
MCEKHYFYKDGRKVESQTERCSKALKYGTVCEDPSKFRHPDGETPRRSSQYLSAGFPPSPPSSDTSFNPSSDGERNSKRRSGTYINGEKVTRSGSRRERRGSNHVAFVEPSSSPRSPVIYDTPGSSPSRSPTYTYRQPATTTTYTSHHDQSYYKHPEVRLEINRPRRDSTVHYEQAAPKPRTRRESYSVGSDTISEEERLRQKLRRETKKNAELKKQAEDAEKRAEAERKARKDADRERQQRKLESEIKRQNESIDSRPIVPSTPYRRGSVSIKQQPIVPIVDSYTTRPTYRDVQRDVEREERHQERRKRKEEEAQKDRLRARMTPQSPPRSSTMGYDDLRRPTVVYQTRDGYLR